MADLVLGLAKTTVEGTVTMARLAMEEEDKLKKSVQRDLLVISDEFEMMQAFINDAKGRVTDNVTRTLVRQVRNTALDVEDCIETIVHLDSKPHWWRRMMLPWCMPAAPPGKDLDAVVANVEQLKARVDAMALRRLRYNRVDDCCHKPAEHQHAAMATGASTTGAAKQSGQVDLIMLINEKGGAEGGQARQGNNNNDEKEEEKDKIEEAAGKETEEAGNQAKGEQDVDDVPELKVISVLGTRSDLDMMFIKKAYDYSTTSDNFKCRAWVKLVHPLNPIEFIRSLLAQFQKNACQEHGNTVLEQVLEAIVVPDDVLIQMFKTQISQKYLVVLEDVSTMVDWEAVKGYLPDNRDGSCIVVHTRHHGIAFSCVGHQYSLRVQEKVVGCVQREYTVSELEMLVADYYSVRVVFKEQSEKQMEELCSKIKVGDKCEVEPGAKRGTVKFVGRAEALGRGFWVGVQYDEPLGKHDGMVNGIRLFECPQGHGAIVRPDKVKGVAGKDSDEDTGNLGKESKYKDWEKKNRIYGRGEDLRWLSGTTRRFVDSDPIFIYSDPSSRVVSVWGMSGVGMSFLIEHFYREREAQKSGNSRSRRQFVWVNVSRPFDLRDVRKSLPSELLNPRPEGSEMVMYFIVIDGLQSTDEWDSIRLVFETTTPQKSNARTRIPGNAFIIIITNEESVANYCATSERFVRNVKSLEAEHAIGLFEQVAEKSMYWKWDQADEERRYRNEQTRDILLNKCGGFPKVICAVAESWRMFRDIKVKDNLVTKLEANPQFFSLEGTFSWLLAYFGSCPDSLKPCIFYLTIFPVNHKIRRRRLVRRWIVEGYTGDNKQITAEETASEFFSRLVKLIMIQPPREPRYLPSSSTRMPLCQVNGFLREYVISRSMEENFVFELEGNCMNLRRNLGTDNHYIKGVDMACVVQHLAIDKSWDRDRNVFESIDFSRLRSLTVFGRWESFLISDKMGRLRVLDLEDVSSGLTDDDVERMVKLLPRLKFLSLRGCAEITHLPSSLGDLKQLQTLDIRGTSVINLPKSIIKLEKLQYIRAGRAVILDNDNTAGTFGSLPVVVVAAAAAAAANPSTSATPTRRPRANLLGSCMPKFNRLYDGPHNGINVLRGIGKLSSLHTLGVVNISAAGGEDILDELKNLTLLQKLGVCGINRKISEKLFSAISRLAHLESLSLQFQLNQDHEAAIPLSPLGKLRSLKLYGLVDRLPTWIMQMCNQLPRLEKLDLQMRKLPQQDLDSIITLRYLRSLRLRLAEFEDEELRFGWSIDQSFGGRCRRDFLEISCNSRLQAVRFASAVDIEILKIWCSSVPSSLQFFGLQAMGQLKEVWLRGSYDDALKKHLKAELESNRNKPILLLGGTTHRQPDGLSSS